MASPVVVLLLFLVFAQFLLIMHLMHQKDVRDAETAMAAFNKLPPPVAAEQQARVAMAETKTAGVAPAAATAAAVRTSSKPAGVAVSLLLHAPKWFQRRYTMMVQNVINNVPSNWAVQIFYTPSGQSQAGIDMNKGLVRLVEQGRVILTPISPDVLKQRKKRFELMYHEWIWENMVADRVLVFGGNSIMCSNTAQNLSSYDEWDYVGAPWDFKKGVGGDGSISLRNRTLMLQVIEYELSKFDDALEKSVAYKRWGQDDIFFISRILEMKQKGLIPHIKLATKEVTRKFGAIGSVWNEDVVAISGTVPGLSDEDRNKLIMACPDIKMVYPALHNPACFGAVPESDKCAASICALKPKTERKGGC